MYNILNRISSVNLSVISFFNLRPDVYNCHNNNGCQRLPHLEVAPVVVGALGVVSNRLDA